MTQDEIIAWIYANPEAKVLELSEPDFYLLLMDCHLPRRPEPPINGKFVRESFFSSEVYTSYDYHAPEYLSALKQYNELCDKMYNTKELSWIGPYGTIEIRIKQ